MEDRDLFKELGLNINEGKLYSELVKHGKLSAAEVSSKAGVPYGKVYVVLQSLIDKGFVRVIPEKTKKFSPVSPESLEKIIDEKRKLLEEAKEKVKELKQFYDDKEKDVLVVGEGDRGFWKIAEGMKEAEKYAYNIKWDSKIRPGAIEKVKKRIKSKKLEMKNLVRYDEETEKNVKRFSRAGLSQAEFPNEGVALAILDDEEVLIGLIKKNTTLLVRDVAFTKCMRRLFLAAYNDAEKIR